MSSAQSKKYRNFLKKLVQARKDAGLTQTQIARLLNKPQSYVSKSEIGERRIDFTELSILAGIYEKPLEFFET